MKNYLLLIFVSSVACLKENLSSTTKEVLLGSSTVLECSLTNPTDENWEHIQVGQEIISTVTSGNATYKKFIDRFRIENYKKYNLMIKDVRKEDAGMYLCREEKHNINNTISVELVVIELLPTCFTHLIPKELVSDNSCGVEPDEVQLSCSVKYFGNIAPVLKWDDFEDKNSMTINSNFVSNTIIVKAEWNRFIYTCLTSLMRYSCYMVVPKPMYLFNTTTTLEIKGPQPGSTTCSANTNQTCIYKWFKESEKISSNQSIKFTEESTSGEYVCTAECSIRGKSCRVQPLVLSYLRNSCYELYDRFS